MATRPHDLPIPTQLLSNPARQALDAAGYTTLGQLAAVREREIAALHGLGPKTLVVLRAVLAEHGLAFAPPARQ